MKFPRWNRKKTLPDDHTAATKMTSLANSDDGQQSSNWTYTEIDEPERFSPTSHELAVVMQSYESFERDIFERIDAIHAAGGLDLGHFDVFDGYLDRERASVEASLVQERDDRSKTAARLTGIFSRRYVQEAKRVAPLRTEHARLVQLRDEIVTELCGHDQARSGRTSHAEGTSLPTPLSLPRYLAQAAAEPDSSDTVLDFPTHTDPAEEIS